MRDVDFRGVSEGDELDCEVDDAWESESCALDELEKLLDTMELDEEEEEDGGGVLETALLELDDGGGVVEEEDEDEDEVGDAEDDVEDDEGVDVGTSIMLDRGLFTIRNCGLVFPELPNTVDDAVRRSARHHRPQEARLTDDHVVSVGDLGCRDLDLTVGYQETIGQRMLCLVNEV